MQDAQFCYTAFTRLLPFASKGSITLYVSCMLIACFKHVLQYVFIIRRFTGYVLYRYSSFSSICTLFSVVLPIPVSCFRVYYVAALGCVWHTMHVIPKHPLGCNLMPPGELAVPGQEDTLKGVPITPPFLTVMLL